MARRKKFHEEEEHVNHERWLVSYADFITLLFAFFVVMYAVSRVDNSRLAQVANALKFALHFEGTGGVDSLPLFQGPPSEGGCPVNVGDGKTSQQSEQAVQAIRKNVERKLKKMLMTRTEKTTVAVLVEGQHVIIRLSAGAFFEAAGVALKPDALPVLDAIGDELLSLRFPVRVEGHTDDRPVGMGRYRNNWELSAGRAVTVADYLQRGIGLSPALISVGGNGSAQPIASNDTPEGREANRRIEFILTPRAEPSMTSTTLH
jgi:chemotaxis protein MotB